MLDPVGIGIGSLRTKLLSQLKEYKPAIVRGNASEIIALAGLWDLSGSAEDLSRARGVDTTDTVEAARDAAVALARFTGGAVVISGKSDLVTDGQSVVISHGGSALMGKVTGFGCSQGGVLAVYATQTDPFTAAVAAVNHYNFCRASRPQPTRRRRRQASRWRFIDEPSTVPRPRTSPDNSIGNPGGVKHREHAGSGGHRPVRRGR